MLLKVIVHELKHMTRDQMYVFFLFFEVVLIATASILLPYLESEVSLLASHLALITLLLMSGIIFGAISGFSMLDDADDGVLFSLKVTPISTMYFVSVKLSMTFIFSLIATTALLFITGLLTELSLLNAIMIVLLSSLQAPFIALIMATFSSNKVEGFVIMKLTGLTLIGPIVSLFLTDWTELLLSIFPGFFPSRMLMMEITNISYTFSSPIMYFIIGCIVNGLFITFLFRMYQKKYLL
jgi:fluoroquinolone transport system permease protein